MTLGDGVTVHVAVPVFTECVASPLVVTPLDVAAYFSRHSPDDPGLEVTLTT